MNAFFKSQFSYSPSIWMMQSRKLNNKINRLHERCLRVTYNDGLSSFEELLERDNSVSVHNRNIQRLAIKLYKVLNGIYSDIMKDVFPLRTSSVSGADTLSPPDQLKQCTTELSLTQPEQSGNLSQAILSHSKAFQISRR